MLVSRTIGVLAALFATSAAIAEPKPSERDKQAAGELVKKAIAKSQAGDHAAAIEIYRQAYTIVPNSVLLSNIASEYQANGKLLEALRYFCMYLEQDPGGANVPYATSQAKDLQIALGNKDVDDRDLCTPPRPERREPRRKERPDPQPPSRHESRTPDEPRDPVRAPSPAKDSTLTYLGLGSGLVGLAAVGVGIYAGVQANSISNDISSHDRTMPWPDNIRDWERRGQMYENVQVGSLIAGGVLVTSGVILYVVGRSSTPTEVANDRAVRLAPTSNGVVVFGRF